jgi:hypothetical protein
MVMCAVPYVVKDVEEEREINKKRERGMAEWLKA